MSRKILLAALFCLVCPPLAWCQSNVSLTRLIETNLVQNTALIHLIIPGQLNGQPGQGEYYLVFYMGVASPSPGVVNQVSGYVAVEQDGAVYSIVSSIPCRDSSGNVIMVPPFPPDLSRGNENYLLYSRNDIVSWVKAYNVVLNMLPWNLAEFQAVMGNSRDYQMTFLSFRDVSDVEKELGKWNEFFDNNPPPGVGYLSPNVPVLLRGVLFFLCVAVGACFFRSFIDSFEKGSF
ncbi:MAG: hypothetical protein FWD31_04380 [Planctomycetaceae bacterium]|nr:hypothetical protein [Planctomycetaceae bacterium]